MAEQARDEHGRFAGSGDGGADLKTWADSKGGRTGGGERSGLKAWAGDKAPRTPNVALTKAAENKRVWTDKQIAGKEDQTHKDHYVDKDGKKGTEGAHPDNGGKPTQERKEAVHDPIVKEAFEGKKTAAELGEKKTAILTMGGPASGKGVVLDKVKADRDLSNFVHVDPDEVKAKLPEYKESVPKNPGDGPTFRGAAAQVHEESSALAKRIRNEAIDSGHHVIVDGTGGSPDSFKALMKKLEDNGYDVHVHYPHLDADTGVKRASARAERSGRDVPERFIRKTYENIAGALPEIKTAAPNFHTYDAKTKGHPKVSTHQRGRPAES